VTKSEQARSDAIRRACRTAKANRLPRYVLAYPNGRYRQLRDMGSPRLDDGVRLIAIVHDDGSVTDESL
jgi:hypothetical protein